MAKRKNGKAPESTNGTTKPVLVRQPNGKGALMSGGTPGNRGGRPRSVLRDRMIGTLEENYSVVEDILKEGKDADKLTAAAFLARYGGMEQKGAVTVDAELLNEFFTVIELYVGDPTQLADIREKWLDVLADRVGSR